MDPILAQSAVAVALFASTNVDDLFVLLAFFADKRYARYQVVTGQVVGLATLVVVSYLASLLNLIIPREYIGLLGIAPVFIGIRTLFHKVDDDHAEAEKKAFSRNVGEKMFNVAMVTIANGADNISVYTPYFASQSPQALIVTAVVFTLMTAVWCIFASMLVQHPNWGPFIKKYAHRVVPFVLIALGVFIMQQAGSIALLTHWIDGAIKK